MVSAWTNQNHDLNHESLFGQFQEIQNESIHLGDDSIHLNDSHLYDSHFSKILASLMMVVS